MNDPHTGYVTRRTRRVPKVKQELVTLQEHMVSSLVCSVVRVSRSFVFFVDSFILPLCRSWYLQSFPIMDCSAHRMDRQYE